jgi:hypothetical protein
MAHSAKLTWVSFRAGVTAGPDVMALALLPGNAGKLLVHGRSLGCFLG